MQPDEFYRLPELQAFAARNGAQPIRHIVDIGANIGDTLLLLHRYFPQARIIGFEPVEEYFAVAAGRTAAIDRIEVHNRAVTADHLFYDDLGTRKRPRPIELALVKALPESGVGWRGGSLVGPADHALLTGAEVAGYRRAEQPITPITLAEMLEQWGLAEIDLLKLDCEGCESSVLGSADIDVLRRVRFMTGEYHQLGRFYPAIRHRLFRTHKICLAGDEKLGAFFAERRDGERDGILRHRTAWVRLRGDRIEWNPPRRRLRWPARRTGVHAAGP